MSQYILSAVKDGTVLPKGYGRLIDADELEKAFLNSGDWKGNINENLKLIQNAPTIIEADEAIKEKNKVFDILISKISEAIDNNEPVDGLDNKLVVPELWIPFPANDDITKQLYTKYIYDEYDENNDLWLKVEFNGREWEDCIFVVNLQDEEGISGKDWDYDKFPPEFAEKVINYFEKAIEEHEKNKQEAERD